MRGGRTRSYPSFPDIEDHIGYNPARFLDVRADGDSIGDMSPLATAQVLIRGMNDVETIRAWIEVEIELGRGTNDSPRRQVIAWLNQRQAALKETETQTDDRESNHKHPPDATDSNPSRSASNRADTLTTASVVTDGGAVAPSTPRCPDCRGELRREEVADEVAHWCAPCGAFRDPAEADTETEER